jgi:hypothetical protein
MSSTAYEDRCALFNHEVYSKPFHGFAITVPRRITCTVERARPPKQNSRAIQLALVNSADSPQMTGRSAASGCAAAPVSVTSRNREGRGKQ